MKTVGISWPLAQGEGRGEKENSLALSLKCHPSLHPPPPPTSGKVSEVRLSRAPRLLLSCVQTGATTPNIGARTMLGVGACVLAVVCKRMQQLQCIVGRIHPTNLCNPCVMSVRGPNNVGRAVQTDPTLLRYASAITEQKKCWELLAEKFDRFQTWRNM